MFDKGAPCPYLSGVDEDSLAEAARLYGEAEAEVRRRLKRQPRVHPQFRAGVQVAMRWLREAMAARLGDVLSARSEDDPRP
jgi:hypothetical protein